MIGPSTCLRQSASPGRTDISSVPLLQPCPPAWVTEAMAAARAGDPIGDVQVETCGSLAVLTIAVSDAAAMGVQPLRAAVADAYSALDRALERLRLAGVRFWNYLPDPWQPMQPGVDRYMVFNAGRFDGYGRRVTARHDTIASLPTASAVGYAGADLIIHCLAAEGPATPVENPRQTSSWRYSSRYGPLPPCFSRATIATLQGRPQLLIGGTASIVGEDSRHAGDIAAQLHETLLNIATVISVANGAADVTWTSLAALTDVRAYVVRPEDAPVVRERLERVCPDAGIELAVSRICRPELLVEIEGVAAVSRRG